MSRPPCPECEAGKHQNCNGITWDTLTDAPVECPCLTAECGIARGDGS